jgi:cytochrome c biogenesis protein CcdA
MSIDIRPTKIGDRVRWLLHEWRPRTQRAQRRALITLDVAVVVYVSPLVFIDALSGGVVAALSPLWLAVMGLIFVLIQGLVREIPIFRAKPTDLDERETRERDAARAAAYVPMLSTVGIGFTGLGLAIALDLDRDLLRGLAVGLWMLTAIAMAVVPLHVIAWRTPPNRSIDIG